MAAEAVGARCHLGLHPDGLVLGPRRLQAHRVDDDRHRHVAHALGPPATPPVTPHQNPRNKRPKRGAFAPRLGQLRSYLLKWPPATNTLLYVRLTVTVLFS